jgi:DNA-binding NarL/FixJ family response regulator
MKILIIDNHPIVVLSLKQLVTENYPEAEIETANSSFDANIILSSSNYDLVICDFFIDTNNGLDIFLKYKDKKCFKYFLLFTILQNATMIQSALEVGVNGIISKDTHYEECIEIIKNIASGEKYICENIKKILDDFQLNKTNGKFITKREEEIIKLIGLDMKNKDIALKLNVSISTVETHKKNLIRKFNLKGSYGLIQFIANNNLFT